MANAVRGGLTAELGAEVGRSVMVLAAWALVAWVVMYRVLARRG
jgi:hypothetical protein